MIIAHFNRIKPDRLLEQFAMFMGKAQILELGLKQLLARRYECDIDQMERWTLGRTTRELNERGLRRDFIALLENLVELRNFVAHELLVGDVLINLAPGGAQERRGDPFNMVSTI